MSRKSTAAALAAVLAVGGASIASAGNDGDDDGDRRLIRLAVKGTGVTFVENGQAGENPGDRIVVSGDLLRGGEKVGAAGLDCTVVRVQQPASLYSCVAGASLPGGQITFQSLAPVSLADPSADSAVTGGTGRYRAARGEATLTIRPGADETGEVTIRLR